MLFREKVLSYYKRNITTIRNLLILTVLSVFTSHLTNYDADEGYDFPIISTVISILIGTLIGIIADRNFKYFERKQLFKTINWPTIFRYVFSTLGYITLIYLPFYSHQFIFYQDLSDGLM